MSIRISPDQNQPSAAIEISLEKPLPDYDLDQVDQPTPRDVDVILVSQGFRDLVDDARGVLTDMLSQTGLEITQLTGAICPGDGDVYRPGLWIVLRDPHAQPKTTFPVAAQDRIASIAAKLAERLQLG
ncbi:MAG TPA: hypothetical protein VG051_04665 [Candidatus Acidoferrum sp.]|nr:hypothetical protein [Candidatus Acidoferrum sp.]